MLVTLNVKNFAIIDNIQIDFTKGLTVLTGETGAGKSLIIDAISLLFGDRASTDLVRFGEQKAVIEGLFSNYDNKIIDYLQEFEIDYDLDDYLIVKREIHSTGKSVCKINNQNVTLNQLKQISEYIGDIHSQLETFGLINPKNYLSFLENEKINELLFEYNELLKKYKKAKSDLNNLNTKIEEDINKQDFLKFQLNELSKAKLDINEELNLQNEIKILSNSENVKNLIVSLKEIFNGDSLDNIYESITLFDKLSKFDDRFIEMKKIVEEAYYNLEAISTDKLLISSNYDFDESKFNDINERLGLYSDLKRKYKKNTSEIIEYYNDIKHDLEAIENFDITKKELEDQVNNYYKETLNKALEIRDIRINNAKNIVEEISSHLQDLHLNNVNFEITFNKIEEVSFQKDGIDQIDFFISFNKGEPMKPLSKTASGGELSRFMLALKTVLGDNLPMQTKIFDEIDSGVSGNIAYSIGKKLHKISEKSQVLCITHLPQVASISDNHYKISKIVDENGRTITKIELLSLEDKIIEVASMISNGKPTEASIKYAEELVKNK